VKLLQLVRLVENGEVVKMSKRTGKSVTLKELIDEVGVNAARYYFSKYSLDTQMDFDLSLAKSKSNENPVFYVCYAYARICSILKGQENIEKCEKYIAINDNTSYNVLEKVYEFPEVVKNAALKELPHLITNYVYELASLFHLYYAKNRVLTENEQETLENLNLIKGVKQTLFNALDLIGVIPPEQM
ncbi:arginine--tRNA ligase, partial [bacterium]|nr:arginine--tRNA ligase [bacterium]